MQQNNRSSTPHATPRPPRTTLFHTIAAKLGTHRSSTFYIVAFVLFVMVGYVFMRLLNTSLIMHFSVLAGVLLLITNLRDIRTQHQFVYTTSQDTSTLALNNALIGAALVVGWLSQLLSNLFWLPAVVLMALATPLALGQTHIYEQYRIMGTRVINRVQRLFQKAA